MVLQVRAAVQPQDAPQDARRRTSAGLLQVRPLLPHRLQTGAQTARFGKPLATTIFRRNNLAECTCDLIFSQVVHGYCRECLASGSIKSPLPRRPTAFSIESLATSSERKSAATPPGGRLVDYPHIAASNLGQPRDSHLPGPVRGFAQFPEPKPGVFPPGIQAFPPPGSALHPGSRMVHYGAVFPWPKLVQPPY